MDATTLHSPALTIAIAMAVGMVGQTVAHHLRVPGIIVLLGLGILLGPDGAGLVLPSVLGDGLGLLTGFAVAVILFEGGLNLKFSRLKLVQQSVRHLLFYGGVITVTGGAIASHYIMKWPWKNAILFGTLVMVTGPTVISPLLKRLKIKRSVATLLEAEGVLIDAVGAVVAAVALEAALSPVHGSVITLMWFVFSRLIFGAAVGGGLAIVLIVLYRWRKVIPEGTENVFTLAMILAAFHISNLLYPESGIAAVTVAGVIVGNFSTYALQDLEDFKEQLTILFIGMLFVLLAADVRIAQLLELGWAGVAVVAVLMFCVRPLAVFTGTGTSSLTWQERLLVACIGPRGIVAAAVASFFATVLSDKGHSGGDELRALVFLVIVLSVLFAGVFGGLLASLLGLRRPDKAGWVILGANSLSRGVAKLFKDDGQEVILIDSNFDNCMAAEQDCSRVIYGNGLKARYLMRAQVDIRRGALALTSNDEVNYLFIQNAKKESKELKLFAVLKSNTISLTTDMVRQVGAQVAFSATVDVDLWNRRIMGGQVYLQEWQVVTDAPRLRTCSALISEYTGNGLLGVAVRQNKVLSPVGDMLCFSNGDIVLFFVFQSERVAIENYLSEAGWQQISDESDEVFRSSVCHL